VDKENVRHSGSMRFKETIPSKVGRSTFGNKFSFCATLEEDGFGAFGDQSGVSTVQSVPGSESSGEEGATSMERA
jgi:hypothetical protein